MRHIIYEERDNYRVALLVKQSAFKQAEIERYYLDPLADVLPKEEAICFDLPYKRSGKAPVSMIKEYLAELLPILKGLGIKTIHVCDANYFKVLTKQSKAMPFIGYVVPCKIKDYEDMDVVLGLNYQQLIHNPADEDKLMMGVDTLRSHLTGSYRQLGEGIIEEGHYPDSPELIATALDKLKEYPSLAVDIETFSLHFAEAGIGTIGFAIDQHNGVAFTVDYEALPAPKDKQHGRYRFNAPVRALLKEFFETYTGRMRWHNATFDIRTLIYQLWMRDSLDYPGMLKGLEVMMRVFDDTKIIAYLATNSTAGNELSLKDLAHEFAGNYAQDDIKDIRLIPRGQLLEYNLVDCLCTNYVYDKYEPRMQMDEQGELYESLMLPSLKVITQMELTGMPLDMAAVKDARSQLEKLEAEYTATITSNSAVQTFNKTLRRQEMEKANAQLKVKVRPLEDFDHVEFNPNSGPQLQQLLFEELGLPVLDKTKTGQPATGGDVLENLKNHTTHQATMDLLDALVGLAGVTKILSTFISAFEKAMEKGGHHFLHGNFNLGGTVSGRLSSSKPNLQNIPSGSEHGKLVKECFQAPPGWIFCGADFNSLEDYISALTTKDPNKLDVYLKGYDGHSLRAYSYFPDRLPGIENTVESINSIKKKFPDVRQASKGPTFSLTYGGTWMTLVKNEGFDEATAKKIEKAYHELYRVSDQWVQDRLDEAAKAGYVEVAFGLKVRTPLLARSIRNHRTTPREAQAEGRTAGNALGQSYGLLNNRAANAFMKRVWDSPFRYDVMPVAQIHDAIYLMIRDQIEVVEFVNNALIEEMEWQELPEIQHDEVKIGAALDLFWPSWAHEVTLPNRATQSEIITEAAKHFHEITREDEAA